MSTYILQVITAQWYNLANKSKISIGGGRPVPVICRDHKKGL